MSSCARVWGRVSGVMLGESAALMVTLQGVTDAGLRLFLEDTGWVCLTHPLVLITLHRHLPVWPWASYLPLCMEIPLL